ncbi:hypothetical protein [Arthrobacter sp. StoSoilA2]|uniref:hypothetical protein n=1 Tax=Arthrobacter sp. StoSoilA2 TaxID=2830990 RepID=UPI001CC607DD|nr:hypothetical protein [Arthrobacter sp. StoSoilA2]
MMVFIEHDKAFDTSGESRMMPDLVNWLRRSRWVRDDSIIVRELPINGRRADLVTMTKSGVISTFELKLGGFNRALEQAVYNRLSVDRSWMVLGSSPRASNVEEAVRFGIGIIAINEGQLKVLCRPGAPGFDPEAKRRVGARLSEIGVVCV